MKTILFSLLLLMLLLQPVAAQHFTDEFLSKLSWLQGKWERVIENPDQTGFEQWQMRNHSFQGLGVTLHQEDTVFVEKLSIEMKENDWYYVADVEQNAEPTNFKITEVSEYGFVSENPDHDFPKRIEYQLVSDMKMIVTISGDGRSVPFIFQKIDK